MQQNKMTLRIHKNFCWKREKNQMLSLQFTFHLPALRYLTLPFSHIIFIDSILPIKVASLVGFLIL